MAEFDDLIGTLRHLLTNKFSPRQEFIRGLMGDGQGNVEVPDRPDKVFARFNRTSTEFFEVFNRTAPPVNDWPILIGEFPWQPGLTQVVDTDWSAFEQSGGWSDRMGSVPVHAPTHEWPDKTPGADPMSVHLRSIVPLRAFVATTGSSVVYVNSLEYENITGSIWPGTPGIDLTPLIASTASGTMRFAGIYLDPVTNDLDVVTGSVTVFTDAFDPPRVNFPFGKIPAAQVRVYGQQVQITEADFRDARRLFSFSVTGTIFGGDLAGGDLTGTYPNPLVAGLFGSSLLDTAPQPGDVLFFTGSAWQPSPSAPATASGDAGGDLTGTYPNPLVAGLFGSSLLDTAPAAGDMLYFTGSAWQPSAAPQPFNIDVARVSKLVAPDGNPDPTLFADNAGSVFQITGSFGVRTTTADFVEEGASQAGVGFIVRSNQGGLRGIVFETQTNAASRNAQNAFLRARTGPAAVQDGDRLGDFFWSGHDGTDYNRSARFGGVVDGAVAANTVPVAIVFDTSETQSGGITERMRIEAAGNVGIGTSGPDAKLDVLATTTQLRLTHTDASKFADFTLDTNHDLTITPSSTGQIILQPTTDSTDFFQVLDADGGTPILTVNSINESVGIGVNFPNATLHLSAAAGNPIFRIGRSAQPNSFLQMSNTSDSRGVIEFLSVTGSNALLDIDPRPADGTSQALFRFFRTTNTSGTTGFTIHKGDGTATIQSQLLANGNSYFNFDSGNVGIATNAPGSLMEWNFSTEDLEFVNAGSAGATEQDWIEVQVGGVTGYIRVFAST